LGVAERREREREQLRSRIIDAARDLLLEQGLGGLSMRAIAERIEYSPATIYIYFKDKDELIREVVRTGFGLLAEMLAAELAQSRESSRDADQYGAAGRAYVRFALENPAYFRVMFELPATADLKPGDETGECAGTRVVAEERGVAEVMMLVRRVARSGSPFTSRAERRSVLMRWGLIHGLTTLYLAGQLRQEAETPEEFMELIEDVMRSFREDGSAEGSSWEAR
jgi:AcrR family transcriptional regulator